MRKEEIIINVIFDADRGEVAISSREAVCGAPVGELPCPKRTGYTFEGWYLNGTLITEESVLTSEDDVRLVARWKKKSGSKRKKSMLKKQKVAAVVLAVTAALLLTVLLVVNYLVVYRLEDVYYDEDGTRYTETYYVKRRNGTYALYDSDGNKMGKNSNGIYIAHSGNQYRVDAESGDFERYAVVDFDADSGEVLGFSDFIMMFPQIDQSDVYSLEVQNAEGAYRFYRDSKGVLQMEGFEDTLVNYDETAFTYLCVSCAYTLSQEKLDFTSEQSTAPRLEDGSIDYSAYGLSDSDNPATYTIKKVLRDEDGNFVKDEDGNILPDPEHCYTVKVGNQLLSGKGYYVQLEGRSSVYVLSSSEMGTDIGRALLPLESLVSPMITYPIPMVAKNMVDNFILGTVDLTGKLDDDNLLTEALEKDMKVIAAFTYQSLDERENTLFVNTPYISGMEEYNINDLNADVVLNYFYDMKFLSCKSLEISKSALAEYGLDKDVFYLSFASPVLKDQGEEKNVIVGYIDNMLLISQKTENNTYYVASFLTDMIVEVDEHYLSFLEWEQNQWYVSTLFNHNLAHLTDLQITVGGKEYDFTLDNSASDQSEGINVSKLKVFCEQYLGGKSNKNQLDYTIQYSYISDTGVLEYDRITGVENFSELCIDLYSFSVEGDFDKDENALFEAAHGMSVKKYISQGEEACDATIFFRLEDLASELNHATYKDKSGNEKKLYTENNERALMIRLYRYTERKALMTVEVIEDYENGKPVSNPSKASALFYVNYSYFEDTIAKDLEMVLNEYPIDPEGVSEPTIIR